MSGGTADAILPRGDAEATIHLALPVDLGLSLRAMQRGYGDPTMRVDGSDWWRATRTPDGAATVRMRPRSLHEVEVVAWGPGARWVLAAAPELLGARDDLDGFAPGSGLIRDLHRRFSGLRITRSGAVFEEVVPTVLAQKVTSDESRNAYRALVRRFGEPAPGPGGLMLPPPPDRLAKTPYHAFHPLGIEMRRANVIRFAARHAARIEATTSLSGAEARRALEALPGIGPWTAGKVALTALGDADAVPVGDFHIPNTVAWALAREARGSDARMLELLEPFGGHRGRVVRLLVSSGITAPKFGPRLAPRSISRL